MKSTEIDKHFGQAKVNDLKQALARAKARVRWLKRASLFLLFVNICAIGLFISAFQIARV